MGNTASGTPRFRIGIGLTLAALVAAVALAPSARTPAFTAQVRLLHPLHEAEQGNELVARISQWGARNAAPFSQIAEGAQENAIAQAAALPAASVGSWSPVGASPLYANDPKYNQTYPSGHPTLSDLGWIGLSGRVTAYAYDPSTTGRYFASSSDGGVWESRNSGQSWRSIGDTLPTQVIGGIAWSKANGGTLVAGTGDNAFCFNCVPGVGVFRTTNDGASWPKATGIPGSALTFRIAVDPSDTTGKTIYAATSKGLFRSTDGAVSFANVNLPTTPAGYAYNCAGVTNYSIDYRCFFANIVTDVVVRPSNPDGTGGGAVLAAIGWRAGQKKDPNGTVQSPQNGIYVSANGRPNTFKFVDPGTSTAPTLNGFAPTQVVGRTALGITHGANQNHDIVYALVQDATKLQGCIDALDIPICIVKSGNTTLVQSTVLDGAYVSTDFGQHWTKLMDWTELRQAGNNSALASGVLGYGPGIQSWYNEWIEPDPTMTDPLTKAPTRLSFGLEEVWENAVISPQVGHSDFKAIGRYWNACLTIVSGLNCNSPSSPIPGTTTHPDQHAGLFVPDASGGGVTLLAGNDGGAYLQHVAAGQDFSNERWGAGINNGLHTLQPYDAAIAKDGTVVAGLQDNGEIKIDPTTGKQTMIFGGDGFMTGIDPDNSKNIVEEYANGAVSVTADGGQFWDAINPSLTSPLFETPLHVDPKLANHFMAAGRDVEESMSGYHCVLSGVVDPTHQCAAYDNWTKVYDLGTQQHPGDPSAASSSSDPDNQASALDLNGDNAYIGYCGYCDVVTQSVPFARGIATNVTGGKAMTSNGWHIATANGLPTRFITSIRMDPTNPSTVYVTLGGYGRNWVPPGALGDPTANVGVGHVFKSTDAGNNFVDISGNLPDGPAHWSLVRNGRLIVATDVGVFIAAGTSGGTYSHLGSGLPNVPVLHLTVNPANPNQVIAATDGRGVYRFTFN